MLRTLVQALGFVLVTRLLGVRGFGAFAGTVAMVSILAPFGAWGSGTILVRQIASAPGDFAAMWRRCARITALSSCAMLALSLGAAFIALPTSVPFVVVVLVAVADLVCNSFVTISAMAYQGFGRLERTAQLRLLPGMLKIVGLVALTLWGPASGLLAWVSVYVVATALAAIASVALVHLEIYRRGTGKVATFSWGEGMQYSVSLATQNIYNDLDKTMLARLSTLEATGAYAAAYRVIELAYLPLSSLFAATYRTFFHEGARGLKRVVTFAGSLMPIGLGYTTLVGGALYLLAPLLPLVAGTQYTEAVAVVRWLAMLPLLRVLHHFAADSLTGAGYQGVRTSAQIGVAIGNFILNLFLLPRYGWRGAVWASLLCDGALACGLWLAILIKWKRSSETLGFTVPGLSPDLDPELR